MNHSKLEQLVGLSKLLVALSSMTFTVFLFPDLPFPSCVIGDAHGRDASFTWSVTQYISFIAARCTVVHVRGQTSIINSTSNRQLRCHEGIPGPLGLSLQRTLADRVIRAVTLLNKKSGVPAYHLESLYFGFLLT
jgi:hypothetical protein